MARGPGTIVWLPVRRHCRLHRGEPGGGRVRGSRRRRHRDRVGVAPHRAHQPPGMPPQPRQHPSPCRRHRARGRPRGRSPLVCLKRGLTGAFGSRLCLCGACTAAAVVSQPAPGRGMPKTSHPSESSHAHHVVASVVEEWQSSNQPLGRPPTPIPFPPLSTLCLIGAMVACRRPAARRIVGTAPTAPVQTPGAAAAAHLHNNAARRSAEGSPHSAAPSSLGVGMNAAPRPRRQAAAWPPPPQLQQRRCTASTGVAATAWTQCLLVAACGPPRRRHAGHAQQQQRGMLARTAPA